jgi:hypothetical protein
MTARTWPCPAELHFAVIITPYDMDHHEATRDPGNVTALWACDLAEQGRQA